MKPKFGNLDRHTHIKGYNERLFSRGIRKWFHLARFDWLGKICRRFNDLSTFSVLELGCFDARSIDYIHPTPTKYSGYDAGWENGLSQAIIKYHSYENYFFKRALSSDDMGEIENLPITLAISLETLEHIPPYLLEGYIVKIKESLNGYLVVTVPNEKGVIFLIKWIIKFFLPGGEKYSLPEVFWATTGNLKFVQRSEHKGFDYQALHDELSKHLAPVLIEGVQFSMLPLWLNVQIGMVFKNTMVEKCTNLTQ